MPLPDALGVGIAIQDVASFDDYAAPDNALYLTRLFSDAERFYCLGMASPARHLAVRLAAKEAVVRALAPFATVAPEEVEVRRREDGRPAAALRTTAAIDYDIRISMSHSPSQAVAVAVVGRRNDGP